jgi:quinol monooxygenase YgiN
MIVCLLKIIPRPDKRHEVMDLLNSVQGPTEVRSGCMECSVFEEKIPEGRILYLEQWSSREAFQEHILSSLYNRVLSAMDLADEPPDISFYEASQAKGLEFVEALRATAHKSTLENSANK